MSKYEMVSIGRENAIKMAATGWWKGMDAKKVFEFQMRTKELCMDFGEFHRIVEAALGRPVWTHEFGLNWDGLLDEFYGKSEPPSMQEIMELIPEEKRIVINLGGES